MKKVLIDKTGQRFGRLTVTGRADDYKWSSVKDNRTYTYPRWTCVCDCGRETLVRTSHLQQGKTTSCGCYREELTAAINRLRPFEGVYNILLRNADERGQTTTLTYDEFVAFTTTTKCYYCHDTIAWKEFSGGGYYLDRKENTLGYRHDNVVVCCQRCNLAKGASFTYEEWMKAMSFLRDERAKGK